MKKNFLKFVTFATVLALTATACGSKDGGSDSGSNSGSTSGSSTTAEAAQPLHKMDVESLVTLCDYKNLTVEVAKASVSDEEVEEIMVSLYKSLASAESGGILDRAVAEGDTVNIDYEGKKDGVAFSGGTATDQNLTIGSDTFIDGFEDGLIGVMPGETVDLNLTFPENYGNADLAGQATVFTVTVNFIVPEVTVDTMDEEVIANIGLPTVTDKASYEAYIREYLLGQASSTYDQDVENAILDALLDGCVIAEDLPTAKLNEYATNIYNNISTNASYYNATVDEYCQYYYGMSATDTCATYAYVSLEQNLILQAIANAEGLNLSDEELDAKLLDLATQSGLSSVEEYLAGATTDQYREYFMGDAVMEYLLAHATIVEK